MVGGVYCFYVQVLSSRMLKLVFFFKRKLVVLFFIVIRNYFIIKLLGIFYRDVSQSFFRVFWERNCRFVRQEYFYIYQKLLVYFFKQLYKFNRFFIRLGLFGFQFRLRIWRFRVVLELVEIFDKCILKVFKRLCIS